MQKRTDVLVYTSSVFKQPLAVAGEIRLSFTAAVSTSDTDFVAVLTDVLPDGRAMILTKGMIRARFRRSLEKEELLEVFRQADGFEHLRIRGLMCMAPNYEDVEMCRPLFREMYGIYQKVKGMDWQRAKVDCLSMGMSHDYEIAVEEGANIVRVGTAIFGPRQY
jgi:hypothetical protein